MLKKLSTIVVLLGLVALVFIFVYDTDTMKQGRFVNKLVARNIEARGGAEAWRAVETLRLTGKMDLGQGMIVPYVVEQKRPGKMRLEYIFNGETAVQSSDANDKTGWKIMPFRGRTAPEPMTEQELRETGDSADPYGLLFDYADRGIDLELQGRSAVAGRDAFKLKVTLPQGAVRWLYLDAETALEVKLEALRTLAGRELRVETIYFDWQEVEGLLISRRQETRTDGDTEWHFLTVDGVNVNPLLDHSRFEMPVLADAKN
ncbi:hypothetical protein [Thalassotalea sp. ND16A]|uniref:hypothetical protein n=1 Tax=Thalassotalea sp. ND16A TaxID=1535422 RepID=UPI00051D6CCF|nr:hypothetical protein [Thalassotalea sp. ND16A]KGJ91580.1 hypothetical protein ND16A_1812 [Thalassotalea sp. ND16A]